MSLQTTLRKTITCEGIGLHSGSCVHMALRPAAAGTGIVFRRSDVERKSALIPARYTLVSDTRLGTTLRNAHGVSVSTVEHLMAALWGMGIDNAVIDLDAPEVPIMDGSSEPFMDLITQAGVRRQDAPRQCFRVVKEVEVADGASSARVAPSESGDYACSLDVQIEFEHAAIGQSRAVYDFSRESFAQLLAPARTFGFAHEVEALRSRGLALGGSLDNAVVLDREGVLNADGLRYPDEFVRHKALDVLGDLYLAGRRIEGAFTFVRPGHGINNKLLRALLADAAAWQLVTVRSARPAAADARLSNAYL